MPMLKGPYDFAARRKQYREWDTWRLRAAIEDIKEVLAAWSDHPNAGWYADDMMTMGDIIAHRTKRGLFECPTCGKVS